MNSHYSKSQKPCSRRQIIAYLECELSPDAELELEKHFAVCKLCAAELNEQKKLARALDRVLVDQERDFEFPDDFTKVVVTSAESNVSGLRRPRERSRALFVCAALFLLVVVGLGKETGTFVSSSENILGQFWAISGYALQFAYDFGVGLAILLRCVGQRFVFNSAVSLGFLLTFFAFTSFLISRLLFRHYRA